MKYPIMLALILCLGSCAYTIPNGGQAVITDVTDITNGQPIVTSKGTLMASPAGSQTHAQARAAQSAAFYGRAN